MSGDSNWTSDIALKDSVKGMLSVMTQLPNIDVVMAHKTEGLYMFSSSKAAGSKDYYIWNVVTENCYIVDDPVDEPAGLEAKTDESVEEKTDESVEEKTDESFEEKLKKLIEDDFKEVRLLPVDED